MRRSSRLPALLCAITLTTLAQVGDEPVRAAESSDRAALTARAAAVLETHCASCHQAGRLAPGYRPDHFLLNILELDTVARDPSLVRPGLPDGSPLYTVMLRRAMPPQPMQPPDARGSAPTGPTAEEMQAVRDWIDALPQASATRSCSGDPAASASREIRTALSRLDRATAADTRFIVLSGPGGPCAPRADLSRQRDAIRQLITRMSRRQPVTSPAAVDTAEAVMRISLDALGWTSADWELLTANAPSPGLLPAADLMAVARATGSDKGAVRADWLAHAVLQRELLTGSGLSDVDGSLAALARTWDRPLDLEAAAVEMAIPKEELARRLENAPPPIGHLARRLLQGLLGRSEFLQLQAALAGAREALAPETVASRAEGQPQPLDFAIWSDKPAYRLGELLTLHAWSNTDCYATLISLDQDDKATVLFPNEMAPENLLRAGQVMTIPGADAPYQFRLSTQGQERIVGVCTVTPGVADGIRPDYERQRFTILGEWRAFLATSWAEPGDAKPAPRRRPLRRGGKRQEQPAVRPSPEQHARTGIRFEVR